MSDYLVGGSGSTNSQLLQYYASNWGMEVDRVTNSWEFLKALQLSADRDRPDQLACLEMEMFNNTILASKINSLKSLTTKFIWFFLYLKKLKHKRLYIKKRSLTI